MNLSDLGKSTLIAKNVNGLNLEQIRRECQELAKSRAKISAGVAIVPLPFLDVAVDVGMLTKLLPQITERFGLEDKDTAEAREKNIKDKVLAVGGLVATRGIVNKTVQGFGGRIIGKQVAKYVPLGGQIVAGTIGYMIFKKITFDHIEECYRVAKSAQQDKTV
ncbi:Uncharacterized protein/domain associated with GTPases [Moraxella caprae]|uniref:Uncharacterized protein/domain associated with GTPases n=1 Tax=Moraxella caprae TaxID=90240 RepID=A0A378R2L9_9GAMM|nr:hypothetical protein [Moraxella caprae]STZ09566.1 Uncharacterized protein/domain associated with GTPases [Moraxella caprae]